MKIWSPFTAVFHKLAVLSVYAVRMLCCGVKSSEVELVSPWLPVCGAHAFCLGVWLAVTSSKQSLSSCRLSTCGSGCFQVT